MRWSAYASQIIGNNPEVSKTHDCIRKKNPLSCVVIHNTNDANHQLSFW
jgi:hypothetical protein